MIARSPQPVARRRTRYFLFDIAIVSVAAATRSIGLALDDRVLASSDLGTMFVPNYAWWWSGRRWLGGWNRWIFGGYPADADPLYGQLHPFGILYASLAALDAAAVEAALGPALAGAGCWSTCGGSAATGWHA